MKMKVMKNCAKVLKKRLEGLNLSGKRFDIKKTFNINNLIKGGEASGKLPSKLRNAQCSLPDASPYVN
ncbi:hypothetical protein [uncultured Photobacterium sp.]|uniref:hypothetical protein n=1 Tax=uncultured Photobacterium sp. TaxID=173973 RepID=UPI00263268BC|nr:hypothetical protein [uncultured Photobacterium sp.]